MPDLHHPIQSVSRRTQLSAHVIRIWEKRYRAVEPERTATNRRLYSEEQIERLNLLRQVTQSGQSIGYVARLPTEKLRELALASAAAEPSVVPAAAGQPSADSLFEDCLGAVRALDGAALERTLERSETLLGLLGMLQRVAAPLAQALGRLWREGEITAAHEHFASAALRTHLAQLARPFAASGNEPVLIVATPSGQLHELGAVLVGALAANIGWRVTYLGPSLPAPEIAGAARQNHARAVALSLVYPADDPQLNDELTRLRTMLPPQVALIVGGQAAPAYSSALEKIGALRVGDLGELGATLDGLRSAGLPPAARPQSSLRGDSVRGNSGTPASNTRPIPP